MLQTRNQLNSFIKFGVFRKVNYDDVNHKMYSISTWEKEKFIDKPRPYFL